MAIKNLWVIMPVYNEEEAIELVVNEWVAALETLKINYVLCLLNDGSKDDTLLKINNLANNYSKLKIINKSNSGHGQTCVMGYQMAIENGADWVFKLTVTVNVMLNILKISSLIPIPFNVFTV